MKNILQIKKRIFLRKSLRFLFFLLAFQVHQKVFAGDPIIIEAEDGILSGTEIGTSRAGFTGTGYVTGFTSADDKITVTTNIADAGTYSLSIRYASEYGNKNMYIYLNGSLLVDQVFPQTAAFTSIEIGEIALIAGENTLEIRNNWGYMDVDNFTLTPPQPPATSTIILEAEEGTLTGTTINTSRPGYTGTGYVTGFTESGDKLAVNANVDKAGTYTLSVRYASEYGNKNMYIYLNGSLLVDQVFPQTAAFTSIEIGEVTLNAGENTLEIRNNWGYMDVDNFTLTPPQAPTGEQLFLEAETATLTGTEISNERSGYTGTGYVTGFTTSGDKLTLDFEVEVANVYTLSIRYASEYGDKTNDIYINGSLLARQVFPQSNDWNTLLVGEVNLIKGNNTLEVRHNWGYMDIDNFTLTPPGAGNTAPVANAGYEQVKMVEGAATTDAALDGSGSTDRENNINAYLWKDAGGNVIGNEAIVQVSGLELGEHVYSLTVTDTEGLSSSDNTKIFVGEATNYGNHRLTLRQGEDQIVKFISGINLAWKNYSSDLTEFDEAYFTQVFDNIEEAGGNALRWWLHTNGRVSPQFDAEGNVSGISAQEISSMRMALDMAHERGIVISMCLFSFDLLQPQGQDQQMMKNLVENRDKTQSYIDNALIPIMNEIGLHPAVMAWEIFNEPEGMTTEFGWTPVRTEMKFVQQFINMTAGAIHRAAPGALVSNGSWSFRAMTDVDGNFNYYRDDRLIAAGGDEDGTLDFYQVHLYPQYNGNNRSPFHRPASWWGLDKPIVIAEYPETGVAELVAPHYNTLETFQLAYKYGYAGVMPWDYRGYSGNGFADVVEAMTYMRENHPDDIVIPPSSRFNFAPKVVNPIPDVNVLAGSVKNKIKDHADLSTIFYDIEDGTNLIFTIEQNTNTSLITAEINEKGFIDLDINKKATGIAYFTVKATDSKGGNAFTTFHVQVKDAEGNLALFKPAFSSTDEKNSNVAAKATDGFMDSRWSSLYEDPQWIYVDLGSKVNFDQVKLYWEAAYGASYEIQVSDDAVNWTMVFAENNGNGGEDLINFSPVRAQYVRMLGTTRGTSFGYSLYEFEVYDTNTKVKKSKLLAEQEFQIMIYPNPASDQISFKTPILRQFNMSVYDVSGKLTLQQQFNANEASIDISSWNKGVYMMIIQSEEERFTRRIIIE